MTNTALLEQNYHRLQAKLTTLCQATGRPRPQLIVASKGRDPQAIAALHALGQRDFGENFTSELEEKAKQLQHLDINWHYIGVLQSNKIARLVRLCTTIQALASPKHARYVQRYAAQAGKPRFPVYLAVNIGAETQKQGFAPQEVVAVAQDIVKTCSHLQVEGLMAVPPQRYCDSDWSQPPPAYLELQRLASCCGRGKLSLGMSADLAIALQAGSTCVRIGRDLFATG